jgi:endothelin-converting enzyme/putative endopeptidase
MKRTLLSLTSPLLMLLAAACASSAPAADKPADSSVGAKAEPAPPPPPPAPAKMAKPGPLPAGLDEAAMDWQMSPCEDFYRFACGGWMDKTEIPADRSSYSRGFITILERNELLLKDILERAAAGKLKKDQPFAKQLGDYWSTCMDDKGLDASLPEVKKQLAAFKNVKDGKALAKVAGKLHAQGIAPLFDFSSMQDLKDASLVVGGLSEGGLGLPDRDYYVLDDEKTKAVRDAYAAHVQKMFELLGDKPEAAAKKKDDIMALETRLAKVTLTNVERRDPEKLLHRLERDGVKKAAPSFDWDGFFKELGAPKVTAINVTHPPFFEELDKIVKETKPETWETYLSWVFLRSEVPGLPKAFQDEDFAYQSKALTGAKEDRPRWKKCVSFADKQLGQALGRVFVDENFGADGKQRTLGMVESVEAAFQSNLDGLQWMDDATRAVAKQKGGKMRNKIGYPDVWRDYASYKTDRKSFLGNVLRGDAFERARDLAKIGKPVDKNEWFMTPPTVNAYNDPQNNEIVFPAGILQPPFFNKDAPDAVNFGAMGMVVGHEITHGFDDEGRKFDADGNLRDWWSADAGKKFVDKTTCVKNQFDGYVAIEDIHVKGDLTLGENTADLGGLKVSLAAMKAWLKDHPAPQSAWTPEQLFFLGYGQSWCTKYRPENARLRAATDPHSPPMWRVNGPLSNMPAFAEAFGCKPTDKMIRKDRCEVW